MRYPFLVALSLLAGPAAAADLYGYTHWYDAFSRCDLHLAARHWGIDTLAAEVRVQELVQGGRAAEVEAAADAARAAVTATGWEVCEYHEAGFTYEDAEQLARVWSMADPAEAKARIEHKLIYRYEADLEADLKHAWATAPQEWSEVDEARRQRFFAAGLDWCDAEALAAMWGVAFDEAKLQVGKALETGSRSWKRVLKKGRKRYFPAGCGE